MIERRNFLRGMAVAPAAVAAAASAGPMSSGLRVSCEKDDPGYRQFCIYNGDGKKITVHLDGVEQKWCYTADESKGMVKRAVLTPEGNIARGHDDFLTEEVYGRVEIKLSDKPTSKGAC